MKVSIFILVFLVAGCNEKKKSASTSVGIDPDIVLVNIENGDRAFIGNLIRAVDSCKPALIAIDVWFVDSKETEVDSVLAAALKATRNDVVAYMIDHDMGVRKSHLKFRSFFAAEGLSEFYGDSTGITMKPLSTFNKELHTSFELSIIRQWKPEFIPPFKPDELVPLQIRRPLEKFRHFDIHTLRENRDHLKNKVVILGYLGPDKEDKHFTPWRKGKNYAATEPDTYGAVIIANTIRTLLDYGK